MTEPTGVAVLANLNLNAIIKLGNSVETHGSNEIEGKAIWPARSMKASTWYSLRFFVHLGSTGEGKTPEIVGLTETLRNTYMEMGGHFDGFRG